MFNFLQLGSEALFLDGTSLTFQCPQTGPKKIPLSGIATDADGTIWDTVPVMSLSMKRTAEASYGSKFGDQQWSAFIMPIINLSLDVFDTMAEINRRLQSHFGTTPKMSPKAMAEMFDSTASELIEVGHDGVESIQEVIRALNAAFQSGLPITMVTGSPPKMARSAAKRLGIASIFHSYRCAGDYAKGKPAPDPYRGFEVAGSLVLEDSLNGAKSALTAGVPIVVLCKEFLDPSVLNQDLQFSSSSEYLIVISKWSQLQVSVESNVEATRDVSLISPNR